MIQWWARNGEFFRCPMLWCCHESECTHEWIRTFSVNHDTSRNEKSADPCIFLHPLLTDQLSPFPLIHTAKIVRGRWSICTLMITLSRLFHCLHRRDWFGWRKQMHGRRIDLMGEQKTEAQFLFLTEPERGWGWVHCRFERYGWGRSTRFANIWFFEIRRGWRWISVVHFDQIEAVDLISIDHLDTYIATLFLVTKDDETINISPINFQMTCVFEGWMPYQHIVKERRCQSLSSRTNICLENQRWVTSQSEGVWKSIEW